MISAELLAAYSRLTEQLGFGLQSTVQIFAAGGTWSLIYQLSDAGLIRFETAHDVLDTNRQILVYRFFFP